MPDFTHTPDADLYALKDTLVRGPLVDAVVAELKRRREIVMRGRQLAEVR